MGRSVLLAFLFVLGGCALWKDSATSHQDLASKPVLRLETGMHTAPIQGFDVDGAEQLLVTGSHDKTVRVWSLEDGRLLQTLRVPIGKGEIGKVYTAALSPDGELVAIGGWLAPNADEQHILVFERVSGRLRARVGQLPELVHHLVFSPDGRHLVATLGGANGIRVFDATNFDLVAVDQQYEDKTVWAAFDVGGRLLTTSFDGRVRLYDASFSLVQLVEIPGGGYPFGAAFSPDGKRVAIGFEDAPRVVVLDGDTLETAFDAETRDIDNGDLRSVAWSSDGRNLYAGGQYGGPDGSRMLRRWANGGRGAHQDAPLAADAIVGLQPLSGDRLAFAAEDPMFGLMYADGTLDWRQGKETADFRHQQGKIALSVDGQTVRFGYEPMGGSAAKFDLASRHLSLEPPPDPGFASAVPAGLDEREDRHVVATDGAHIFLGSEKMLRLLDMQGQELWRRPAPGVPWSANVSGEGRLAVMAYGDGTIRWYRVRDGQQLLAFCPHADRRRWVLWTPQGYYMASPGGEELIGWHVNRSADETPDWYSMTRFRDHFNRPDILELVLEEEDVEQAVARANEAARATAAATPPTPEPTAKPEDIIAAGLPPMIQIVDPADGSATMEEFAVVTYQLRSEGTEAPKISVHLNGQFVKMVTLGGPTQGDEVADQVLVPLAGKVAGNEAVISLIVEDEIGASDPVQVALKWGGEIVDGDKPRLFVLAIGVSDYAKNPPADLSFAAQDAEDIISALKGQEGGLYREVKVLPLLDQDAVASEIIAGFRWLREEIDEGDVVMVFFSGHGATDGLDYYFLPHDVDARTQDDLVVTAIDRDDIRSALRILFRRQAKVLAFFDTCHAGAMRRGRRNLMPDVDRLISELTSPENGVIVFTSSTGREVAWENPEWENGAFTEALLEAFAGKAAHSGRGHLTVADLQDFLPRRVRELTEGEQNPQVNVPFEKLWNAPILLVQ